MRIAHTVTCGLIVSSGALAVPVQVQEDFAPAITQTTSLQKRKDKSFVQENGGWIGLLGGPVIGAAGAFGCLFWRRCSDNLAAISRMEPIKDFISSRRPRTMPADSPLHNIVRLPASPVGSHPPTPHVSQLASPIGSPAIRAGSPSIGAESPVSMRLSGPIDWNPGSLSRSSSRGSSVYHTPRSSDAHSDLD